MDKNFAKFSDVFVCEPASCDPYVLYVNNCSASFSLSIEILTVLLEQHFIYVSIFLNSEIWFFFHTLRYTQKFTCCPKISNLTKLHSFRNHSSMPRKSSRGEWKWHQWSQLPIAMNISYSVQRLFEEVEHKYDNWNWCRKLCIRYSIYTWGNWKSLMQAGNTLWNKAIQLTVHEMIVVPEEEKAFQKHFLKAVKQ